MYWSADSAEAMTRKRTEASQKKRKKKKNEEEKKEEEDEKEEKYIATLYAHTNGLRVSYRSWKDNLS